MDGDFFATHAAIGRRWGWWSAIPITVFWILLWPIGLVWCAVSGVRRYRALDRSPEARTARRTGRMSSWYPARWRDRHGADFAETVEGSVRDGHGGPGLTWNVVRESGVARAGERPTPSGAVLWAICWLPLVGQGLAPMIVRLAGGDARALFVALYLPTAWQWPFMIAMVALGLALLVAAVRTGRPASNRVDDTDARRLSPG